MRRHNGMWVPEPPGMVQGGLTDGRAAVHLPRQGDSEAPGDSQFRWGTVQQIASPNAGLSGVPTEVTIIDTPILRVPTPMLVSLQFSQDRQNWSPVPAPPSNSFILVKTAVAVDPRYGIRNDSYTIGPVGGQNVNQPGWARRTLEIAAKLSVTVSLDSSAFSSSYQTWVSGTCTPLSDNDDASFAGGRIGSNLYGFPSTNTVTLKAMIDSLTGNAQLVFDQHAWRQQFWIRNLPPVEQPAPVIPQTVYIGFGNMPFFDAVAGIWKNYVVALAPGETYESFPIEQGSFWGNVWAASAVLSESSNNAPWIIASESDPFTQSQ